MRCNQPGLSRHALLDAADAAVAGALATVDGFVAMAGCSADAAARLAIVVEELVGNIVEHGEVPAGGRIGLTLTLEQAAIGVRITDTGRFHDPRELHDMAELPPERGGGAGIRLVLAWSRILACRRIDGGNELLLEIPLDG